MARAYATAIIEAPVEVVWATIRDFSALAAWNPGVSHSEIEGGGDPDAVGCIRALTLQSGGTARERLLMLGRQPLQLLLQFRDAGLPDRELRGDGGTGSRHQRG